MSKAVIITGATGTQGGALITALLEAGADFEIIAVTRDPNSGSAQRLSKRSPKIKVIQGNLDKVDEIFDSAKKVTSLPIWGVYSVQAVAGLNPFDDPELRQGNALIDAALRNNVEMFVYSSVDRGGDASYDDPTFVPHFRSKHEIEHHLIESSKGTNMTYTILRPVAFMDNFQPGFGGKVFATLWDVALGRTKPLQLIAASDIGFFGAQAFLKPDEYRNRSISLAGDEVTYDQFAQAYKDKTGEELENTYTVVAWLVLLLKRDLRLMFKWFYKQGYAVDIERVRKVHPGLKNVADYFEQGSQFTRRSK